MLFRSYCKPALTLDEQIDLLTTRGLIVPDRDKARHYPRYVGYNRLSGYFLTLQQRCNVVSPHTFLDGITFKDSWTSSVKSILKRKHKHGPA